MRDFLNLVIDLRDSNGRNEASSIYVAIKHKPLFSYIIGFKILLAQILLRMTNPTNMEKESKEDVKNKGEIKRKN